jgi:sialate O-acetylesterase
MKAPVFLLTAFAALVASTPASAGPLALHPLFSDHAVLQQELPAPVWGTADPNTEVTVTFAGQTKTTRATATGDWILVLDPLVANATPQSLTASAAETTLTLEDVLVGEVWVGSGQSNMAMSVDRTFAKEETAAAAEKGEYKGVRLFKVPVEGSDARMSSVEAEWQTPSAATVARFSATAFFFAAQLAKDRNVPVGIIQSANGGTNAFSWINSQTVESDPAAEAVREAWSTSLRQHPTAMERYKVALAAWREKVAAAKKSGVAFKGRAPSEPLGPEHPKRPAGHYNAMVAPLQPYAIRGVIWYQGEANSRPPFNTGYRDLMFALVEDWRADWTTASAGLVERRDFPFYLVQLPGYAKGDPEGWPLIREQMLRFWQEGKNTGMVVAIDKGEPDDIHPRDKKPVGERLARFARANAYGENIVFSGPIYKDIRIEGDKAIVTFDHAGGGLTALDGKALAHFEVAGADARYVPATATVEGTTLVVKSDDVREPRAVRYAWSAYPEGANFGNTDGLPASPFRSDSW